ncbi:putative Diguanylate cyclase [Vibrio nigripulchritudo MADA3029]|uniref:Diguanylate cyclase n=1 Tax=Vibrio nigripulchritudo SOn1 TaxID=1238450 RepID=A0AAV2VL94_9VIBR|nr:MULTISPECIES: diguanylate cyclase [Vibrio]EGU59121.1 diguanylate cyclase/phosphodiesterase with PAS/PAC sensor(s) [Vibrio nigripulchritudo ATCC 27043]KJY75184.1 hypothetical protein TW74_17750 [Vibrio nigripulchritudo]UAB72732.1 diguanylate cyclase [Vibrio sp. SCSIO 43132]CCN37264.1 putative Diguanylate cyclase [Vibrio nigripulchritudo AM115]CCN42350.1 putative Diguanylate cyclase [Vibrio nigripulchritudo FTn2]
MPLPSRLQTPVLLTVAILFTLCAVVSVTQIVKSLDLLAVNEHSTGRAIVQLMLLHQEYMNDAENYFRGLIEVDELLTSYDLTWSAFEILLVGSESANLMERQGRLEIIVDTFESFKELDPTLDSFNEIHFSQYLAHGQQTSETINALLNEEFQRVSEKNYSRDLELVRLNSIMGYSYAGLAICGSLLLYITLKDRRKISHLAYHDSLTGLANRAALQNQLIDLKRQNSAEFTVLLLDLDGFKLVNDTYGHDVGDRLLKRISARLLKTCGEGDFIARLGGDEFAIIQHSQEEPQVLPEKIIESLSKPIKVGSVDCKVGVSIGICLASEYQDTWVDILKAADIAMYQAKSNGGNSYDFFDDAA